jgi:NAD(P)-dependent dehydrogenase (short-subunit alcohol dehydrogenase family)
MFEHEFEGKVVVITGGTRGIGWRCVERFSRYGASVLACGNDAVQIAEAERQAPPGVQVAAMDVRLDDQVRNVFATSRLLAEGVDVLVNCAGIQRLGNVVDTDPATWDDVMSVNVTGAYLVSRYAIPAMRRKGGGAIVHVASVHARLTGGRRAAYAASKSALVGLCRAMALDHGPENIRVNVVSPGAIDTTMLRDAWAYSRPDRTVDEMRTLVGEATPIGRVGTTDDVVSTILFLCSSAAGFVTGAEIPVDGGISGKLGFPTGRPKPA